MITSIYLRFAFGVVSGLLLWAGQPATAQSTSIDDPVIASYQQEKLTIKKLEEFARELPSNQRVPWHLSGAGEWRRFMSRELTKCLVFSKEAMALRRHLDPAYIRGREYFIQEYLDYLILRDLVYNKIDVSREAHEREFTSNPGDYHVTPTVSLRYIRTKNADAASSAAARIAKGEDFTKVEAEISEVSPRYLGRVLGPFPNPEARTMIPPPVQVINLANELAPGETSGPLQVGAFHFIVRTEMKSAGGASGLEEVTEKVEDSLRQRQGDALVQQLLTQLKTELDVKVDDQLLVRRENISDDDVLATVGAVRVTRREFTDLNGRVRGPATNIANMQPTRLSAFVVPIMLAEAAKLRGYMDREETKRAIFYYDIQHLATYYVDEQVVNTTPIPTDRELRFRFAQHFAELKRANNNTTPSFEMAKPGMVEAMVLERRPVVEEQYVSNHLSKLGFKVNARQPISRITAFEALVQAADRLSTGARILEITEALGKDETGPDWYLGVGRNTAWRISYANADGAASELMVQGPALINDGSPEFTSTPLYMPLYNTWKYDTDALFRYAIDRGMGDFAAKHKNEVRVVSRVEFAYSPDDPTSATDCLISYVASPADESINDGLIIKYSGITGEITKRRAGDPEGQCPTCPGPDLPSTAILQKAAAGATDSATTPSAATQTPAASVGAGSP